MPIVINPSISIGVILINTHIPFTNSLCRIYVCADLLCGDTSYMVGNPPYTKKIKAALSIRAALLTIIYVFAHEVIALACDLEPEG